MSYYYYDELDYETVITHGGSGPNQWGSITQRRRDPAEAAKLKAERARKHEDEILAQADAIRARRGL